MLSASLLVSKMTSSWLDWLRVCQWIVQ